MSHDVPQGLLEQLKTLDTPTVCNAIEVAQGRRGFADFTRQTMYWSEPAERCMVGFARTATIAGSERPEEGKEVLRARRMDYFRSMADGPRPGVAVIEDADGKAAIGAWWGEVHAYAHGHVFGLCGAITNGLMRDLDDLPSGFPILAGGIGPSHGFVHVRKIGTPVTVMGLQVCEGDLLHADQHGAIVIPPDVIPGLPAAIDLLHSSENLVLGPIKAGRVSLADFELNWAAFERART
ncbi:MAG: RraA family protein [Granulosicoccus sp.]